VKEPSWLTLDAVLAIHEQLVAEHGGSSLLRDRGLLESALPGPRNHFACGERDLYGLAATYASGITRNHPFADGNKRIAFMAAYTFLGINGIEICADEDDVVEAVLGLSTKSISREGFADWLTSVCVKRRAGRPGRSSRKKK
jgi:death-on-curing protein